MPIGAIIAGGIAIIDGITKIIENHNRVPSPTPMTREEASEVATRLGDIRRSAERFYAVAAIAMGGKANIESAGYPVEGASKPVV